MSASLGGKRIQDSSRLSSADNYIYLTLCDEHGEGTPHVVVHLIGTSNSSGPIPVTQEGTPQQVVLSLKRRTLHRSRPLVVPVLFPHENDWKRSLDLKTSKLFYFVAVVICPSNECFPNDDSLRQLPEEVGFITCLELANNSSPNLHCYLFQMNVPLLGLTCNRRLLCLFGGLSNATICTISSMACEHWYKFVSGVSDATRAWNVNVVCAHSFIFKMQDIVKISILTIIHARCACAYLAVTCVLLLELY